jgi:hypothetical protein
MTDFYIVPAGSGTSGNGLSRKNPIVGLSSVNNNAIGAQSGDRLIFLPGVHYEQFVVPSDNLDIIFEDTIFDGRFSLNGSNTLNNSYVESALSGWTNLDSLGATLSNNIWRKGCNRIWSIWVDGVLCTPMATSNLTNSVATISSNIGSLEYTMRTETTDTIGATLYLRLPAGKTPNDVTMLGSSTGRYIPSGTSTIQTGVIEVNAKYNIYISGKVDIIGIYHAQGHRVVGFYAEQCVNLLVDKNTINVTNCFVPARIAGGSNVKFSFVTKYCNNCVAVQNSNEATSVKFPKAGTIEIYDWYADHCGWMPRYDGSIVNANADMDGGVGIGYKGGDIAKVIVRNGICTNGGPSILTLPTGWSGSVNKGSGVICSTGDTMSIDELVVVNNFIDNTARTGISTSGSGLSVAKKIITGNLITNTRPIPIATNWQSSIIGAVEKSGQSTATELVISDNTISGGKYTASGIYVDRVHASSTAIISNNILKDITIESGYAGNYGVIQIAETGGLTINNNIFDNAGGGVIGRVLNTSYTTLIAWQSAGYDINGQQGTVTIATNGAPSAGTANPIGTGLKWWGNSARPVGIDGNPFPDTNIDIGCFQTSTSLTHPVNIVSASNIHTSENLYNLIQSLTASVTSLQTQLDAIESFKFSPSIYSGEVTATTTATNQSEIAASGTKKLYIENKSLVNSVYIGIGGSFAEAETNCSTGWAGSTRHRLLPDTSAYINLDGWTHFAWVSLAGTATIKITQGV